MASAYGWPLATVRELTDEQFVLVYLDAAAERVSRNARSEFEAAVEAVRMGTVFAYDAKAYNRWTSRRRSAVKRPPLTPEQLEVAIAGIARDFPGQVVVEAGVA